MLEKWLKEAKKPETSHSARKEGIKDSLTEDSCFWARVEEAIIWCEQLKQGDKNAIKELVDFKVYVVGLIDK